MTRDCRRGNTGSLLDSSNGPLEAATAVICPLDNVMVTLDHIMTDCSYNIIHAAELLHCLETQLPAIIKQEKPKRPQLQLQLDEVIPTPLCSFYRKVFIGSKQWSCALPPFSPLMFY